MTKSRLSGNMALISACAVRAAELGQSYGEYVASKQYAADLSSGLFRGKKASKKVHIADVPRVFKDDGQYGGWR